MSSLLLDYFLPVIKLVSKTRVASKVRKVYDKPLSPCQRLLASPDLSDQVKAELTRRYQGYNPVSSSRRFTGRFRLSWN